MTKYEMIESRLKSIQVELRQIEQNGTGLIQYAERNYFTSHCKLLKNHAVGKNEKNFGAEWDAFVKIAKGLFNKSKIQHLTYEEADICVSFLNECVDILNKYEDIVEKYRIENKKDRIGGLK